MTHPRESSLRRRVAIAGVVGITGFALLRLGASAAVDVGAISVEQPTVLPLNFPRGGSMTGLAKGDFNGDGAVDVAASYKENISGVGERGFLSVFLNDGRGTFQAHATRWAFPAMPNATYGSGTIARDFDGDGRLDLAVAAAEVKAVLFFKGQGDGRFATPVASMVGQAAIGLQVGQLNRDTKWDLVTVNPGEGTISVLLGNGNGTFGQPTHQTFASVQDVAVADVNRDGAADIVACAYSSKSVISFLNDGAGVFQPTAPSNARGEATGLYVADFNGDGKADAAVSINAGPKSFAFGVMNGSGDGTFVAPADDEYRVIEDYPGRNMVTENVAPDLNGDGRPDVVFGSSRNYFGVGTRSSTGLWDLALWVASPAATGDGLQVDSHKPYLFLFDDFNGDKTVDIIIGSVEGSRPGALTLAAGRTDQPGTFRAGKIYRLSRGWNGSRRNATLVDWNKDGVMDLLAVTDALDLALGDGAGGFMPASALMGHVAGPGEGYAALDTADFDRDGIRDALWLGTGGVQGGPGPRVLISYGNVDRSLEGPTVVGYPDNGHKCHVGGEVALADFNGDGYTDFAVWLDNGCGNNAWIQVFLYNPATPRTFVVGATLDLASTPFYPAHNLLAADVDGDKKADLVTRVGPADTQLERVYLFRGKGDGAFEAPIRFARDLPEVNQWAAGDLNNDNILDLVAFAGHGAFVLMGAGRTLFLPVRVYDAGSPVRSGTLVDLDGDGELDIVLAANNSGVTVFRGGGDGTFEGPKRLAVGNGGPEVVLTGDLNKDGRSDLVVGHGGQDRANFTVLVNTSMNRPPPPFSIRSVTPSRGGDGRRVSVDIHGKGFAPGTRALLTLAGQPDVVGETVSVAPGLLTATFDLAGRIRGAWDVVLTSPDRMTTRLSNGFVIEENRSPEPWVDIVGRNVIRAGRTQFFTLLFGNRGNVDAVGSPVIRGIPKGVTWGIDLGQQGTEATFDPREGAIELAGETAVLLPRHVLPPGSSMAMRLWVTVPDERVFELGAVWAE